MTKIGRIKPTNWGVLKTDAINFDEEFYWLDDYPFRAELAVLQQNNCQERCIVVDLSNSNCLQTIKSKLSMG